MGDCVALFVRVSPMPSNDSMPIEGGPTALHCSPRPYSLGDAPMCSPKNFVIRPQASSDAAAS